MIAKYNKAVVDQNDRDIANIIIELLTSTGRAVVPDSIDVDVQWPKATASNIQSQHRELSEFLGQEMSKAALGQTLTTESGSRGARSLGEVHETIREDVAEADAVESQSTLTRDLVSHFYEFNWPGSRKGSFYINTDGTVDVIVIKDMIRDLADRVDIPQDWAREQLNIRKPLPGEQICGENLDKVDPSQKPKPAEPNDQTL
jgi:phage gp29-like protein